MLVTNLLTYVLLLVLLTVVPMLPAMVLNRIPSRRAAAPSPIPPRVDGQARLP